MANVTKDPVAKQDEAKKAKEADLDMEDMGIDSLKMSDFKPMSQSTAAVSHPFDGYPRTMVTIGKVTLPRMYVVAINPSRVYVHQDPSMKGRTVKVKGKDTRVDFENFHSRVVHDVESGGKAIDVVFDREIVFKDGQKLYCAFVPSHSARAALMFKIEPKSGAIQVDRRYNLLDNEQRKRLRDVFRLANSKYYAQLKLSNEIAGEAT